MMARLLGLLSSDRFAREISAVTRVIVILKIKKPHFKLYSSLYINLSAKLSIGFLVIY